jgi:hypothetical protein
VVFVFLKPWGRLEGEVRVFENVVVIIFKSIFDLKCIKIFFKKIIFNTSI